MSLEWSLKEIYPSFKSKEFKNDLEKVDVIVKSLNDLSEEVYSNNNYKENLEKVINLLEKSNLLIGKIYSYCSLTISTDSKNLEARKFQDIITVKNSSLTLPLTKIYKWIGQIENIEEIINSSDLLLQHKFVIEEILEKINTL